MPCWREHHDHRGEVPAGCRADAARHRPSHRQTVLDDLRGHFADAADLGRPIDETVAGLGSPAEIAERAREEFGAGEGAARARADAAWRALQGTAVGAAVVTGVVVAFLMPSSMFGMRFADGTTFADGGGLGDALLALVPAVACAIPLLTPRSARTAVTAIVAVALTAIAAITFSTIGGFFAPSTMLAWAALLVWMRLRGKGFGLGWRIGGGVLAAAPSLAVAALGLPFRFGVPYRYSTYTEVGSGPSIGVEFWGWVMLAGIVALGVLVALGRRAAGWVLAAIGLAVLVAGLTAGGILMLAFVWLGGWWLTIGLAHAVTSPTRRRSRQGSPLEER
ncbi:hypothetical protein L2X99_14675 [Microbacterium sp. KUDC0406]|uniref:HAAS signaling domain-containing protein n=1 Tax=Microbacterium sp. KUDC0406 TaxID=2909588 RepID=UPI001F238CD8|nr:hypothetical protein [Microbacterium sp. KUDC0406]UJP09641.1 hypothetical protein L2X99_14675 [Microbacterium sp. KUDC0406]